MDKRFLTILGVLVLIFIGIIAFSGRSNNNKSGTSSHAQPTNHIEGKNQKNVTLVEYGDYECPICGAYYQPLKQAEAQLDNDIHFQFRNLPLTSIHKNAFAAARAAEAAGLQGKFWQMHDVLYENQDPSGGGGWVASDDPLNNFFVDYAKQFSLDITKFKSDYASSRVNDAINADIAAFLNTSYINHDANKEATPTFFLDGKYLSNTELSNSTTGQPDVNKIVSAVNKAIAAKNKP
jgi:protein-disulfide isomerase